MGLSQSFCLSSVILLFKCSISRCRNSMLSSGGGGCCGCCWPPALPPPPLLGPPPTPAADAILLDEVVILTDVAQQGVLADVRVDYDEVLSFLDLWKSLNIHKDLMIVQVLLSISLKSLFWKYRLVSVGWMPKYFLYFNTKERRREDVFPRSRREAWRYDSEGERGLKEKAIDFFRMCLRARASSFLFLSLSHTHTHTYTYSLTSHPFSLHQIRLT